MNTNDEVGILLDAIKEYGSRNGEGRYSCSYGVLFNKTADTRGCFVLFPDSLV